MSWTLAMFNAIRNDPATGLANLPEATVTNIKTIQTILNADPDAYNKYVTAMVQRIGMTFIRSEGWSDPLSVFDKAENPMMHVIQEIHIDPIHAEGEFDGKGTNPLGRRTMENVDVAYHKVNYKPQYVVTIDSVGMLDALRDWDDNDRFWAAQMESMYTGAEIDTYRAKMLRIGQAAKETEPGKTVPSAYMGNIIAKDQASGLAFMQGLKYIVNDLKFPNTNNMAGCVCSARPEELVLLVNKDLQPNLDVYTLASLFNDSVANTHIRMIAVDTFSTTSTTPTDNGDILGLLTVPDFFQFYPSRYTVEPQRNAQGLFTNFFFNPWKAIQLSPFKPAVFLRTGEGT